MGTFSLRPRIRFGPDALEELEQLRGQGVLIVTDRFFSRSGLLDRVTEHLEPGSWTVFDKVQPDPGLRLVAEGAALLRERRPAAVVALGGGSPMDCAKAIRHFGGEEGCRSALWCIPTTAGTGSEVTAFSVLTDEERGRKVALVDDALLPDAALLDPGFLAGVPAAVTADTGMDVISHAVEAYVARDASPFTDALAEGALLLAWDHLKAAEAGDRAARAAMLYASCLAGMAFNAAGLGICHSLAHALGGRVHLPHGRLNAILLPRVVQYNGLESAAARKYRRLAGLLGAAGSPRALAGRLARLARSLGMPERLPEGTDRAAAARDALGDRCTPFNPRPVTEEALQAILREVGA